MIKQTTQSLQKQKQMSMPINFTSINLNDDCFFRCQMCFKWQPDIHNPPNSRKLTTNEIKGFISDLSLLVEKKHVLNIAGGEPFLRRDLLEIIKFSSTIGFHTQIATNGWLINSKQKAKEIVESGLGGIIFSIDGATAQTHDKMRNYPGSFERAMQAIKYLGKYKESLPKTNFFIGVQAVLCEMNYNEAIEMINLVDKTPYINSIHFNAVSEPNNTMHDPVWYKNKFSYLWPKDLMKFLDVIDKIYEKKKSGSKIVQSLPQLLAYKEYFKNPNAFVKKNSCHFDKSLCLSSIGDMFLCYNYNSIGNIREIRLIDAWNSKLANEVKESIIKCKKNCHALINCNFGE